MWWSGMVVWDGGLGAGLSAVWGTGLGSGLRAA